MHRPIRSNFIATGIAVLNLILIAVPVFGQRTSPASIGGLAVAGPERPSAVPAGFVITPFGYFHPSCVRSISEPDLLLADGRVAHANSKIDRVAPACAYPHYTSTGSQVATSQTDAMGSRLPAINGWVEYDSIISDTSYGEISATWTVPPEPTTSKSGQAVFFFPGFQDTVANLTIVQPVLQWYAPGPWAMASWNCCVQGMVWHSIPKKVHVGDTLFGFIAPDCQKHAQDCGSWKIATKDLTTGKKSVLRRSPADGQVWDWAFGGVLEAYGITQCSDLPANDSLLFTVQLYDQNRNLIANPEWVPTQADPGLDPSCNYNVGVTPTQVTLWY